MLQSSWSVSSIGITVGVVVAAAVAVVIGPGDRCIRRLWPQLNSVGVRDRIMENYTINEYSLRWVR